MRIALGISYLGTTYQGWQSQPSGQTVQDKLERALSDFATVPELHFGCLVEIEAVEPVDRRAVDRHRQQLRANLRQHAALVRSAEELGHLLNELAAGLPYDILSVRLDTACAILAEITGEITSEEVLRAVFDGFCIGK